MIMMMIYNNDGDDDDDDGDGDDLYELKINKKYKQLKTNGWTSAQESGKK